MGKVLANTSQEDFNSTNVEIRLLHLKKAMVFGTANKYILKYLNIFIAKM